MSAISEITERLNQDLQGLLGSARKRIFGINNERLDFFMDSFYKLDPQRRVAAIGGLIGVVIMFVIGAMFIYFSQVQSLQDELNDSFAALNKLKALRVEDSAETKRFNSLTKSVQTKTRGLNFKPFFEKLSRQQKVNISNLREDKIEFDPLNPLSEDITQSKVSMKLPKISIPKLLKFLVEIERAGKYMRVTDLKITGLYGNKLYFDANIIVRGYSVKR